MAYTKLFNPKGVEIFAGRGGAESGAEGGGDRRDGSVYVYADDIVLAVNVALATARPLLLRGPSGSGKSSLARNVARVKGWRYYEEVISSRTQARDLLWRFDTLRRLSDAQVKQLQEGAAPYVEPGVLWWAFDQQSARRRGLTEEEIDRHILQPARERARQDGVSSEVIERDLLPKVRAGFYAVDLGSYPEEAARAAESTGVAHPAADSIPAVVLLDEIDKADPDTPNNLLVPLGSYRFAVPDLKITVGVAAEVAEGDGRASHQPPLIFITSNDERELPAAFLRRCVILNLEGPNDTGLVEIAKAHFAPPDGAEHAQADLRLYRDVAVEIFKVAKDESHAGRPVPSAAEYLDALRACRTLKIRPRQQNSVWQKVAKATLWKPRDSMAAGEGH